jgi:hypothetical protein
MFPVVFHHDAIVHGSCMCCGAGEFDSIPYIELAWLADEKSVEIFLGCAEWVGDVSARRVNEHPFVSIVVAEGWVEVTDLFEFQLSHDGFHNFVFPVVSGYGADIVVSVGALVWKILADFDSLFF